MNQLGQEEPIGFSRLILTTSLIALVFILWATFFTPSKPPEPPVQKVPAAEPESASKAPEAAKAAPETIPAGPVYSDKVETVKLENGDIELQFSNKGAVLVHAYMKKFKEKNAAGQDDLVSPLAEATKNYPLSLVTGDEPFDKAVNEGLFHVEQSAGTIAFKWADGKGNSVVKTFMIDDKGYTVSYDIGASRGNKPLETVPVIWGPGLGKLSKAQAKNRYYQQEYVGYESGGRFNKAVRSKKMTGPLSDDNYGAGGNVSWAGIANNYFTVVFIPEQAVPSIRLRTIAVSQELQQLHPSDTDVALIVETKGKGKLYLGPKDYPALKNLGGQIFRMMNWGWSWFSSICAFLLWGLNKLYAFSANYGVAILLLTLIMKLCFYPLTQNSMVKMKEMGESMKKLKPQIDKIKAKYKKIGLNMQTRAKMNEEVMQVYKIEGVNPLGGMSGCLPMLLQLPVFWALFTMLPNTIDLRGAHFFLWIKDLSLADPYYITPILMGVSMMFSTVMTGTQMTEPSQKMMMYTMPVIFTWFCLWAPAGLTLYWLANNLLTMGQQTIINKQVEKRALAAQKLKKSTPKGPSRPSHA
jgi:YidC/Oxa1 family membrane protein insertase